MVLQASRHGACKNLHWVCKLSAMLNQVTSLENSTQLRCWINTYPYQLVAMATHINIQLLGIHVLAPTLACTCAKVLLTFPFVWWHMENIVWYRYNMLPQNVRVVCAKPHPQTAVTEHRGHVINHFTDWYVMTLWISVIVQTHMHTCTVQNTQRERG